MNKFLIYIFILFINAIPALALQDDFVNQTLAKQKLEKPYSHTQYNYQSTTKVPIKLSILENISEDKVYEGQPLKFKVCRDVCYDDKVIIKKDTIIPARLETVITSGMNGIPASMIIGDFRIPDIPQSKITDNYEVIGQDRSLWVFPLKWALTPLPPTGSLTNFILGGHARLKTKKVIEIYYYPDWI